MQKRCDFGARLGSSYYVETDRVEYFLPGGFTRLLKESAKIRWPEDLKRFGVKTPEVTGGLVSSSDSLPSSSMIILLTLDSTSDRRDFGTDSLSSSLEYCDSSVTLPALWIGDKSELEGDGTLVGSLSDLSSTSSSTTTFWSGFFARWSSWEYMRSGCIPLAMMRTMFFRL